MGLCDSTTYETIELHDLPARRCRTGDRIAEWELKSPFGRCAFFTYSHLIHLAHAQSGGHGYVTFEAMAEQFNTPVWKPIRDRSSNLCQVLFTYITHEDKPDCYDFDMLVMLGLLHN